MSRADRKQPDVATSSTFSSSDDEEYGLVHQRSARSSVAAWSTRRWLLLLAASCMLTALLVYIHFGSNNTLRQKTQQLQLQAPPAEALNGALLGRSSDVNGTAATDMRAFTVLQDCRDTWTVLSAADLHYYDALRNMLGSLHRWGDFPAPVDGKAVDMPPGRIKRVVVWDLGFTEEQHNELAKLCYVEVIKFDFDAYPPHFRDLHTFAFKPTNFLQTALRFPDTQCIMMLDSGMQLNAPVSDVFMEEINTYGFWLVTQMWPYPNRLDHPNMFKYFGVEKQYGAISPTSPNYYTNPDATQEHPASNGSPMQVAGGIVGLRNTPLNMERLFQPWADCAKDKECITPTDTGIHNHRQDQSALNFLIWARGPRLSWLDRYVAEEWPRLSPEAKLHWRISARWPNSTLHPWEADYLTREPPLGVPQHLHTWKYMAWTNKAPVELNHLPDEQNYPPLLETKRAGGAQGGQSQYLMQCSK